MTFFDRVKGKKLTVRYESGFAFTIVYPEEGLLSWKALGESIAVTQEEERYEVLEIRDGLYFVNWVEGPGTVLSQLLDFESGKVSAFMTWNDENAFGKRAKILHKGTFTVEEA